MPSNGFQRTVLTLRARPAAEPERWPSHNSCRPRRITMKTSTMLAGVLALAVVSLPARAGLYTDDLSRCLVEKTSKEDRAALVRWMFTAAAAHPAVASIANVNAKQQDEANKAVGAMFMKLLTDSCKDKAKQALTYEGLATIQMAFQVLGQVAAGELFASPEVTRVIAGLEKYTDTKKLEELTKQ